MIPKSRSQTSISDSSDLQHKTADHGIPLSKSLTRVYTARHKSPHDTDRPRQGNALTSSNNNATPTKSSLVSKSGVRKIVPSNFNRKNQTTVDSLTGNISTKKLKHKVCFHPDTSKNCCSTDQRHESQPSNVQALAEIHESNPTKPTHPAREDNRQWSQTQCETPLTIASKEPSSFLGKHLNSSDTSSPAPNSLPYDLKSKQQYATKNEDGLNLRYWFSRNNSVDTLSRTNDCKYVDHSRNWTSYPRDLSSDRYESITTQHYIRIDHRGTQYVENGFLSRYKTDVPAVTFSLGQRNSRYVSPFLDRNFSHATEEPSVLPGSSTSQDYSTRSDNWRKGSGLRLSISGENSLSLQSLQETCVDTGMVSSLTSRGRWSVGTNTTSGVVPRFSDSSRLSTSLSSGFSNSKWAHQSMKNREYASANSSLTLVRGARDTSEVALPHTKHAKNVSRVLDQNGGSAEGDESSTIMDEWFKWGPRYSSPSRRSKSSPRYSQSTSALSSSISSTSESSADDRQKSRVKSQVAKKSGHPLADDYFVRSRLSAGVKYHHKKQRRLQRREAREARAQVRKASRAQASGRERGQTGHLATGQDESLANGDADNLAKGHKHKVELFHELHIRAPEDEKKLKRLLEKADRDVEQAKEENLSMGDGQKRELFHELHIRAPEDEQRLKKLLEHVNADTRPAKSHSTEKGSRFAKVTQQKGETQDKKEGNRRKCMVTKWTADTCPTERFKVISKDSAATQASENVCHPSFRQRGPCQGITEREDKPATSKREAYEQPRVHSDTTRPKDAKRRGRKESPPQRSKDSPPRRNTDSPPQKSKDSPPQNNKDSPPQRNKDSPSQRGKEEGDRGKHKPRERPTERRQDDSIESRSSGDRVDKNDIKDAAPGVHGKEKSDAKSPEVERKRESVNIPQKKDDQKLEQEEEEDQETFHGQSKEKANREEKSKQRPREKEDRQYIDEEVEEEKADRKERPKQRLRGKEDRQHIDEEVEEEKADRKEQPKQRSREKVERQHIDEEEEEKKADRKEQPKQRPRGKGERHHIDEEVEESQPAKDENVRPPEEKADSERIYGIKLDAEGTKEERSNDEPIEPSKIEDNDNENKGQADAGKGTNQNKKTEDSSAQRNQTDKAAAAAAAPSRAQNEAAKLHDQGRQQPRHADSSNSAIYDSALHFFQASGMSYFAKLLLTQMQSVKTKNRTLKFYAPPRRGLYVTPKPYPVWIYPNDPLGLYKYILKIRGRRRSAVACGPDIALRSAGTYCNLYRELPQTSGNPPCYGYPCNSISLSPRTREEGRADCNPYTPTCTSQAVHGLYDRSCSPCTKEQKKTKNPFAYATESVRYFYNKLPSLNPREQKRTYSPTKESPSAALLYSRSNSPRLREQKPVYSSTYATQSPRLLSNKPSSQHLRDRNPASSTSYVVSSVRSLVKKMTSTEKLKSTSPSVSPSAQRLGTPYMAGSPSRARAAGQQPDKRSPFRSPSPKTRVAAQEPAKRSPSRSTSPRAAAGGQQPNKRSPSRSPSPRAAAGASPGPDRSLCSRCSCCCRCGKRVWPCMAGAPSTLCNHPACGKFRGTYLPYESGLRRLCTCCKQTKTRQEAELGKADLTLKASRSSKETIMLSCEAGELERKGSLSTSVDNPCEYITEWDGTTRRSWKYQPDFYNPFPVKDSKSKESRASSRSTRKRLYGNSRSTLSVGSKKRTKKRVKSSSNVDKKSLASLASSSPPRRISNASFLSSPTKVSTPSVLSLLGRQKSDKSVAFSDKPSVSSYHSQNPAAKASPVTKKGGHRRSKTEGGKQYHTLPLKSAMKTRQRYSSRSDGKSQSTDTETNVQKTVDTRGRPRVTYRRTLTYSRSRTDAAPNRSGWAFSNASSVCRIIQPRREGVDADSSRRRRKSPSSSPRRNTSQQRLSPGLGEPTQSSQYLNTETQTIPTSNHSIHPSTLIPVDGAQQNPLNGATQKATRLAEENQHVGIMEPCECLQKSPPPFVDADAPPGRDTVSQNARNYPKTDLEAEEFGPGKPGKAFEPFPHKHCECKLITKQRWSLKSKSMVRRERAIQRTHALKMQEALRKTYAAYPVNPVNIEIDLDGSSQKDPSTVGMGSSDWEADGVPICIYCGGDRPSCALRDEKPSPDNETEGNTYNVPDLSDPSEGKGDHHVEMTDEDIIREQGTSCDLGSMDSSSLSNEIVTNVPQDPPQREKTGIAKRQPSRTLSHTPSAGRLNPGARSSTRSPSRVSVGKKGSTASRISLGKKPSKPLRVESRTTPFTPPSPPTRSPPAVAKTMSRITPRTAHSTSFDPRSRTPPAVRSPIAPLSPQTRSTPALAKTRSRTSPVGRVYSPTHVKVSPPSNAPLQRVASRTQPRPPLRPQSPSTTKQSYSYRGPSPRPRSPPRTVKSYTRSTAMTTSGTYDADTTIAPSTWRSVGMSEHKPPSYRPPSSNYYSQRYDRGNAPSAGYSSGYYSSQLRYRHAREPGFLSISTYATGPSIQYPELGRSLPGRSYAAWKYSSSPYRPGTQGQGWRHRP